MNETPTPRIIQLLMSPNDSLWQGVLLGLGDDGVTYHCQGDTWQPYIPPLNPQDKAADLTAITVQRDMLAEALQMINSACQGEGWTISELRACCSAHCNEALQSLTQTKP